MTGRRFHHCRESNYWWSRKIMMLRSFLLLVRRLCQKAWGKSEHQEFIMTKWDWEWPNGHDKWPKTTETGGPSQKPGKWLKLAVNVRRQILKLHRNSSQILACMPLWGVSWALWSLTCHYAKIRASFTDTQDPEKYHKQGALRGPIQRIKTRAQLESENKKITGRRDFPSSLQSATWESERNCYRQLCLKVITNPQGAMNKIRWANRPATVVQNN